MKTAIDYLKCAVLASLVILIGCVAILTITIQGRVASFDPAPLINARAAGLQEAAVKLIGENATAIRTDLFASLNAIAAKEDARIGQALGMVDGRTKDVLAVVQGGVNKADAQFTITNQTISQQQRAISAVLKPAGESVQQVNEALPLWLDCQFNPDCAFNRYQGVSKAIEQMAQAGAKAAPRITSDVSSMADSGKGIAASVELEAETLTAPQTKWAQIRAWMLFVARIVGAI